MKPNLIVTPVERQCSSGAHRQLHCKEADLPWDLWCANCKRRFIKPQKVDALIFGERYVQTIEENHRLAVRMMREEYPNGCGLCGERAGAEMGEFWLDEEQHARIKHTHISGDEEDSRSEHSVIAHAQCGIDAELEMA